MLTRDLFAVTNLVTFVYFRLCNCYVRKCWCII